MALMMPKPSRAGSFIADSVTTGPGMAQIAGLSELPTATPVSWATPTRHPAPAAPRALRGGPHSNGMCIWCYLTLPCGIRVHRREPHAHARKALAAACLALLPLALSAAPAAADDLPEGKFQIKWTYQNVCAKPGNAQSNRLINVACNSGDVSQQWRFDPSTHHLQNMDPAFAGKCLSVNIISWVIMEECDETVFPKDSQDWQLRSAFSAKSGNVLVNPGDTNFADPDGWTLRPWDNRVYPDPVRDVISTPAISG